MRNWTRWTPVFAAVAWVACRGLAAGAAPERVPIIYTTDLYHPHDDPDDHFDLATLFAIPEFDIRAIVIDTGQRGANRPGIAAIQQMMHITGRDVPCATGLTANLRTPDDRAEQQPAAVQGGVELILKQLREAQSPVTIFTAGSLRDVAAAFNRAPDLLKAKVARLYVNAGHSSGKDEWNVKLDPHAYVRILRSGLPVYWAPCFGDNGYQTLWKFRQGEVLDSAPLAFQNFFVYALTKAAPEKRDPIKALSEPIAADAKEKIWAASRNMWCTAPFLHAAGRTDATFTFERVAVEIDEKGVTRIVTGKEGLPIFVFHTSDPTAYAGSMRQTLSGLLSRTDVPY